MACSRVKFTVLNTLLGAWDSVAVKALRYLSDGPGIDSRWWHWGFFPWYPPQNHARWGRLSLWKWVPGIFPGIKAAGAFGWRPTTFVVPERQEIPGLNLTGTPWATSACRGTPLLLHISVCNVFWLLIRVIRIACPMLFIVTFICLFILSLL